MNRESKLWLLGAGGVVVVVLAVVLIFGLSFAPEFPNLYEEEGPTIEGTVAYVDYGRDECVRVLDVGTGESEEIYCDRWLWLEGWDQNGNLRIHVDNGRGEDVLVLNPGTGEVLITRDFAPDEHPPSHDVVPGLRASSHDGHATLLYRRGDSEVTLIDVDGPRDYSFWDYGLTTNENYAWVCDSEDRLLVVAVDGTSGPWLVADSINEAMWK